MSDVFTKLGTGPLGYGTADVGNHRLALTEAEARAVLEEAWTAGVRHFDTAPHYGLGLAERRLGDFLAALPRSEYVVSTKVGRLLQPRQHGPDELDPAGFLVPASHERVWDFSAAGVRRSAEESLGRLGLDRLDVVYLHDPEQAGLDRSLGEGLSALVDLKQQGLATLIGVGSMDTKALVAGAGTGSTDVLMVAGRYTLADHVHAVELLETCTNKRVGIVAAAVFNGGLLAGPVTETSTFDYRPASSDMLARARRLAEVCASFDVPLRSAALRFPLRHPMVRAVVVGGSTPEQVRQNVADVSVPIPPELWDRLRDEGLVTP